MKYVILGNGPAGMSALQTLLAENPEAQITIIGNEARPYSRILITYALEEKITRDRVFIFDEELLNRPNVEVIAPVEVVALNTDHKSLLTATGDSLTYDRLLIATGGAPKLPPIPGINGQNIYTIRDLADTDCLASQLTQTKSAVLIGGGMVGLKMAQALHKYGIKITVIDSAAGIMAQSLDPESAAYVARYLEGLGISIITGVQAQAILDAGGSKLIQLNTGQQLQTDLIFVGVGVAANCRFIDRSRLKMRQGIIVDEYLRTTAPDVFAAGDVIETWDRLDQAYAPAPIWPNAVQQGRIAALNMSGARCSYTGSIKMNSIQLFELPVVSVGNIHAAEHRYAVEILADPVKKSYKRLVFDGDRLTGAVLIGQIKQAGVYRQLIAEQKTIKDRQDLLRPDFNLIRYTGI